MIRKFENLDLDAVMQIWLQANLDAHAFIPASFWEAHFEMVRDMLSEASRQLRAAGFTPYYLYRQKYMSGSFENVGWTKPGGTGLYNIYIMEELHSILSLGAGGSTKMVGGGQIRRAFNAKYPREYIDRPEKRRANLMDFARFYAEQGE